MPAQRHDKPHQRKHRPAGDEDAERPLGLSKIKASIRQTKRLLAKDNLNADVRLEAQRKLEALERELEAASVRNKEKSNATRYHAVKFFERQKIVRKLGKVLKALEKGKAAEGDKATAAEAKRLKAELLELRIDLNYIINYPKVDKYVSLFPGGQYTPHQPHAVPDDAVGDDGSSEASPKHPDLYRARMRAEIKAAMERGELSAAPETTLGEEREGAGEVKGRPGLKRDAEVVPRSGRASKAAKEKAVEKQPEADDFFV